MDKILKLKKEDFEKYIPSNIEKLFGKKSEIIVDKQLAKEIYFDSNCHFSLFKSLKER